jgi:hypothetical protein
MGAIGSSHKVNLIAALLSRDADVLCDSRKALMRRFGRIDLEGPVTDFTHTTYYDDEMGRPLMRQYLSFKRLFDQRGICSIKLISNAIESRFAKSGKRTVNIDPGYLDLAKLVLFSTKDYTHRIYLDKGIFAEVTLFYKDKGFNPWPWTYPDYKEPRSIDFFNEVRRLYKVKIS